MTGSIEEVYITSKGSEAMERVEEICAVENSGLRATATKRVQ